MMQETLLRFTLLNCTRGELRDLAVAAVNAGGETLATQPHRLTGSVPFLQRCLQVPTVITRHCARRPFKPENLGAMSSK